MDSLPNAVDAERNVLGSLMFRPESLAQISDWLSPNDFYVRENALIYQAICELTNKQQPADALTVGEWLESQGIAELVGGTSYVLQIASDAFSAANIVAHAEIIAEKSRLRRAVEIGGKLAAAAVEKGAEAGEVMAAACDELMRYQATKIRTGLQSAKPIVRGLVEQMQSRMGSGNSMLGIPTPWIGLNQCTRGLRKGVLYVVGARPSMGKSVFGFQLAAFSALRGVRTGLFSVEMGQTEVIGRMVSCCAEVPHDWIEFPDSSADDSEIWWERVYRTMADLSKSGLLIDDTPALKIEQLRARARRAHMQQELGLAVIDHLHDMAFDGSDEMRFKVGRAVQGAKSMAKELNIPVVLLAQLNRSVAGRSDKSPTMTDLRESGEIEQKADAIFFLHREDYYNKGTHMQGVVELIPAKGRNVKVGDTIYLQNRFDQMRLDDWIGPIPQKPEELPKGPKERSLGTNAARKYAGRDD